jgi:hypothetical protein
MDTELTRIWAEAVVSNFNTFPQLMRFIQGSAFLQHYFTISKTNKLRGLVRQRTIPTERPPLVGEVSANFSG